MIITETRSEERTAPPSRFREQEARGVRLGGGLRRFGGVSGIVDERLMARIGDALMERDEPAAALAHAIQMRAGESGKVTHAQLRVALSEGIQAVPGVPAALEELIALVSAVPDWVDWDLIDRGARLFARMGSNAANVLLQLSLVGGYRFGGPSDLLVATGGLTGSRTRRRLAETHHWAASMFDPGALRPGGEAWRLTVHVRVMHALINAAFESRWDVDRWGLPINQADQAGTLGLFDGPALLGCRALGVPIAAADSDGFMHMWKYVGWLMGVDPDFLTDDEGERHRINYHILLAAPAMSAAGPSLARALYDAQADRRFPGWPDRLQGLRGRFEQERLLSMLTGFLGSAGMRDLELPIRPPWAFACVLPLNVWRYRILDRLPGGTDRREKWGRKFIDGLLRSYFAEEAAHIARLPHGLV